MKNPFEKSTASQLKRVLIVGSAVILCTASLAGCTGKKNASTEPSINIIEETVPESTAAPVTEATAPVKENMAIVKEKLKPRTSPSLQSGELETELNAGDELQILRIETVNGTPWAYSKQGWIPADLLDLSNVSLTIGTTSTPNNPAATEANANAENNANSTGNSNNNTTTANNAAGKMGVVTASDLNVRSEPTTNGNNIVAHLAYGDRVTISESKDGWGKTDKGWISLQHVYVDGTTGPNACKGIVTGSGLNVRSGPGTNYGSVANLNKSDRVNVLNRIKIGDYTWGCIDKGWIRMDYVYVDGTAGPNGGNATITGDALNIRSGPGTKYDVVGSYTSGASVKIFAQFTMGEYNWGCTDKGWIRMDYVEMD